MLTRQIYVMVLLKSQLMGKNHRMIIMREDVGVRAKDVGAEDRPVVHLGGHLIAMMMIAVTMVMVGMLGIAGVVGMVVMVVVAVMAQEDMDVMMVLLEKKVVIKPTEIYRGEVLVVEL